MKVLTLTKTDKPGPLLYVDEDTATEPTRSVTINHVSEHNHTHPRNIQLSNEFVFVKRYGSATVGIHVDDLIQLLTSIEPSLSWPPKFIKNVMTQGDTVTVEAQFESHNPELTTEQNAIAYKWQQREHPSVKWSDITEGGIFSDVTTNKISVKNSAEIPSVEIRCVATNAAGSQAGSIIASRPPVHSTEPK